MKTLAAARLKRVRAVELVATGRSYDEIAREVGYSHRGSAHRVVYKALAEREVEAVDDLCQMGLARLDRLQASLWGKAMDGDIPAVNTILRITDQRIRLMGLDTQPSESDESRLLVRGPG